MGAAASSQLRQCRGAPQLDERLCKTSGMYPPRRDIDDRKLRNLILAGKLAPCYPGKEAEEEDGEGERASCDGTSERLDECPICMLNYPALNRSACCRQGICTECFLQVKPTPGSGEAARCPFCNSVGYSVQFTGVKSAAEHEAEERERQRVALAIARARADEQREDEDELNRRASAPAAMESAHSSSPGMPEAARSVASQRAGPSAPSTARTPSKAALLVEKAKRLRGRVSSWARSPTLIKANGSALTSRRSLRAAAAAAALEEVREMERSREETMRQAMLATAAELEQRQFAAGGTRARALSDGAWARRGQERAHARQRQRQRNLAHPRAGTEALPDDLWEAEVDGVDAAVLQELEDAAMEELAQRAHEQAHQQFVEMGRHMRNALPEHLLENVRSGSAEAVSELEEAMLEQAILASLEDADVMSATSPEDASAAGGHEAEDYVATVGTEQHSTGEQLLRDAPVANTNDAGPSHATPEPEGHGSDDSSGQHGEHGAVVEEYDFTYEDDSEEGEEVPEEGCPPADEEHGAEYGRMQGGVRRVRIRDGGDVNDEASVVNMARATAAEDELVVESLSTATGGEDRLLAIDVSIGAKGSQNSVAPSALAAAEIEESAAAYAHAHSTDDSAPAVDGGANEAPRVSRTASKGQSMAPMEALKDSLDSYDTVLAGTTKPQTASAGGGDAQLVAPTA